MFVGGIRMRKTALDVFNSATALDSPEGDTTVVADFTFDAETNAITLLATPAKRYKSNSSEKSRTKLDYNRTIIR